MILDEYLAEKPMGHLRVFMLLQSLLLCCRFLLASNVEES